MRNVFSMMLFLLLSLSLVSCSDKQESAQSCAVLLDKEKYSTVAVRFFLIKKNILRLPRIQTVQIMKEAVLIWDRQEYTSEIFLKKELLIT